MKSNFGASVTIKRWGKLSWEDFQGVVKPFTGFAAGINSYIFLEYDSIHEKYNAYAGQNNQRSWAKDNLADPEYVLNHEQYHFNISELHARKLNEQLDSLIDEDPLDLLFSNRVDLKIMQKQFDDETDHGLERAIQKSWEYKIDSMLLSYETDSVFKVDHYSGARFYFPDSITFSEGTLNNAAYRAFVAFKYDMGFSVSSWQIHDFDASDFNLFIKTVYQNDSIEIKDYLQDTKYNYQTIFVSANDSLNNKYSRSKWVKEGDKVYRIYADFSKNIEDSTGYLNISDSFINSFSIIKTDDYFLNQISDLEKVSVSTVTDVNKGDDLNGHECFSYLNQRPYGFYWGPSTTSQGDLVIAYHVIEHSDSLIQRNLLVFNNKILTFESRKEDQMYIIPKHEIPDHPFWASLGYVLKEDTSKTCYSYYNQMIFIDPSQN